MVYCLECLCCSGNAKVVLDQSARDMPEVGNKNASRQTIPGKYSLWKVSLLLRENAHVSGLH
jgi:hypothetical protein